MKVSRSLRVGGLTIFAVIVASIAGLLLLREWAFVLSRSGVIPAIAKVELPGSPAVEIYEVLLAPEVRIERSVRSSWLPLVHYNSSSAYAMGGMTLETEMESGEFHSAALSYQAESDALGIAFRVRDAGGSVVTSDWFASGGEDYLVTREDGVFRSAAVHGRQSARSDMVVVEIGDGKEGWRRMDGPVFPDTKDGRGLAILDAFPRDKPFLRLRVTVNEQPPLELEVPTPGHKPSLAPLVAESLPAIRRIDDGEVILEELNVSPHGLYPIVKATHRDKGGAVFRVESVVRDVFGNQYAGHRGAWLLPGESVVRIVSTVTRRADLYPYAISEVTPVAMATLSRNEVLTVGLADSAEQLGVSHASVKRGPGGDTHWGAVSDSLRIHITARMPDAQRTAFEATHHLDAVCVFNGDRLIQGESRADGRSWSTDAAGNATLSVTVRWLGDLPQPPSMLQTPSVLIAIPKIEPPKVLTFDIAVPNR